MNESIFYEIKTTNAIYQDVIEEIGSQLKKDQYIQSESVLLKKYMRENNMGILKFFQK